MARQKCKTHFTNPHRMGRLPITDTSFEAVVEKLQLLPQQYPESAELRAWVKRNKRHKYVPPDLLKLFGFKPAAEI